MEERKKERWWDLCELAANEEDPEKLFALAREINQLLEEKEAHPKREKRPGAA
jgi:hypothetical protein